MATQISAWRAEDGTLHDTEDKALERELRNLLSTQGIDGRQADNVIANLDTILPVAQNFQRSRPVTP